MPKITKLTLRLMLQAYAAGYATVQHSVNEAELDRLQELEDYLWELIEGNEPPLT